MKQAFGVAMQPPNQTSGDLNDSSKARIAMRDPNGPWRHGSVYLYVLDLTSNIVLFHAAFPNRFELQPLVGIARDGVTGELILPSRRGADKAVALPQIVRQRLPNVGPWPSRISAESARRRTSPRQLSTPV